MNLLYYIVLVADVRYFRALTRTKSHDSRMAEIDSNFWRSSLLKQSYLELVAQDPIQMASGHVLSGRSSLGIFADTFPLSSWICWLNASRVALPWGYTQNACVLTLSFECLLKGWGQSLKISVLRKQSFFLSPVQGKMCVTSHFLKGCKYFQDDRISVIFPLCLSV